MTKDLVKHNINFLEYPLWFQDDRLAQTSEDGMVWTDIQGYVYRAGYKPPVKTDAIFLLYLLLQSQRSNYAETLTLSRYQVLQDCGFGTDAGWYDRLEESLKRWKMVGILFEGTFYDDKEYKAMNFGIIDGWEIRKEDKALKIWFSPRFIEMMRGNGFFKYIKFSEFKQLRSSLATRLYEILSKSFYLGDTFSVEACLLAEKIPMKERYAAHIVPKIRAAVARINKSTNSRFDFSTRPSDQEKRKTILCFRKLTEAASDPVPAPKPKEKSPLDIPQTDEVKALIALLPPERQNQRTILEIILGFYQIHGTAYVARNIRYTRKHATKNFRPYLLKALRGDFGLAMEEDEEVNRQTREKETKRIDEITIKQVEDSRRRRLEEEAQKRARAYIAGLAQVEKAVLEREALASMPEKIRQQVERNGVGARIMMTLAMDRVAIARLEAAKVREQPSLPSVEATE